MLAATRLLAVSVERSFESRVEIKYLLHQTINRSISYGTEKQMNFGGNDPAFA
jgi:hypothetical protein